MEPEWRSLNEFMRRNQIGYNTALKLMSEGKVEYQKIGKQYKIKVTKDEKINEQVKKLIEENAKLKAYIKTIQNMANQINI